MVNIAELSSKELFELARKKEQEEARLEQMHQQLKLLKEEREDIARKQQDELQALDDRMRGLNAEREAIDKRIDALKSERAATLESQAKALALVDKRINSMAAENARAAKEREEAETATAEPVSPQITEREELPPPIEEAEEVVVEPQAYESQAPRKEGKSAADNEMEALKLHIRSFMKGRSYISETLLKEKLQTVKFKTDNLSKALELLVKQAWLVRRTGGNYVLGKSSKR